MHYEDHKDHKLAFNTKTMNLWCYRCDFDLIEEGLQLPADNETESSRASAYRGHVEKLYDYLCKTIGDKYKSLYHNEENNGKSTATSTGFKSYSHDVGQNSKCKFS